MAEVTFEHFWPRFCEAIDHPDLQDDEWARTNEVRVENRDALESILDTEFEDRATDDLLETSDTFDVPASDIRSMDTVFENPQVGVRGLARPVDHPSFCSLPVPCIPLHVSRSKPDIRPPPPRSGKHTEAVFEAVGYDEEMIASLEEASAI